MKYCYLSWWKQKGEEIWLLPTNARLHSYANWNFFYEYTCILKNSFKGKTALLVVLICFQSDTLLNFLFCSCILIYASLFSVYQFSPFSPHHKSILNLALHRYRFIPNCKPQSLYASKIHSHFLYWHHADWTSSLMTLSSAM